MNNVLNDHMRNVKDFSDLTKHVENRDNETGSKFSK